MMRVSRHRRNTAVSDNRRQRALPIPIGAGPIVDAIGSNYKLRNRIKVALGVHNGKSMCGNLCVAVPQWPNWGLIKWRVYAWDTSGLSWLTQPQSNQEFGIGWSRLDRVTMEMIGSNTVVCAQVRNWKHDRPRHFELHVTYMPMAR